MKLKNININILKKSKNVLYLFLFVLLLISSIDWSKKVTKYAFKDRWLYKCHVRNAIFLNDLTKWKIVRSIRNICFKLSATYVCSKLFKNSSQNGLLISTLKVRIMDYLLSNMERNVRHRVTKQSNQKLV